MNRLVSWGIAAVLGVTLAGCNGYKSRVAEADQIMDYINRNGVQESGYETYKPMHLTLSDGTKLTWKYNHDLLQSGLFGANHDELQVETPSGENYQIDVRGNRFCREDKEAGKNLRDYCTSGTSWMRPSEVLYQGNKLLASCNVSASETSEGCSRVEEAGERILDDVSAKIGLKAQK